MSVVRLQDFSQGGFRARSAGMLLPSYLSVRPPSSAAAFSYEDEPHDIVRGHTFPPVYISCFYNGLKLNCPSRCGVFM